MKKLSIVTAIHNQIEYNRLFLTSLEESSSCPYELIIIDNASTDGSAELFREHGALVLSNSENHCYACSQNQGIASATGDYIAFLNNDIYLSPHWDEYLLKYMEDYNLDVLSPSGIETMESPAATKQAMRRWRRINVIQRLRVSLGIPYSAKSLQLLVRLMYGNWQRFNEKRHATFNHFLFPGIAGNSVVVRRSVFDKIGLWNTSVPASDWDLQLRLVKRQTEHGDVKQAMIAGDVFIHHFIRATFRATKKKFACTHAVQSIPEFYSHDDLAYLNRPLLSMLFVAEWKSGVLEKLLTSLSKQTVDDFEIILIDSGSEQSIERDISGWKSHFKYPVRHCAVSGGSAGFIQAVRQARSSYLCFAYGNCIVHNKFVEEHSTHASVGAYLVGQCCELSNASAARLTPDVIKTIDFAMLDSECTPVRELDGVDSSVANNLSLYAGDFYRACSGQPDRACMWQQLVTIFNHAGMCKNYASSDAMQYRIVAENVHADSSLAGVTEYNV
jgi:glycosyltransferase involved in cell wall biosynthesis